MGFGKGVVGGNGYLCSDHLMSQLEGEGGWGGKGVVGGNGYLCSDHLMSQLEGEGGGLVKG